jgi:hypothetical protein
LGTSTSVVLYVDGVSGNDKNDGLGIKTPKKTIQAALAQLPPVLRHPVTILLSPSAPYSLASMQNSLNVVILGDGTVVPQKFYTLGNLSYTIQEAGRLTIASMSSTPVVIDGAGVAFGDGPVVGFFRR